MQRNIDVYDVYLQILDQFYSDVLFTEFSELNDEYVADPKKVGSGLDAYFKAYIKNFQDRIEVKNDQQCINLIKLSILYGLRGDSTKEVVYRSLAQEELNKLFDPQTTKLIILFYRAVFSTFFPERKLLDSIFGFIGVKTDAQELFGELTNSFPPAIKNKIKLDEYDNIFTNELEYKGKGTIDDSKVFLDLVKEALKEEKKLKSNLTKEDTEKEDTEKKENSASGTTSEDTQSTYIEVHQIGKKERKNNSRNLDKQGAASAAAPTINSDVDTETQDNKDNKDNKENEENERLLKEKEENERILKEEKKRLKKEKEYQERLKQERLKKEKDDQEKLLKEKEQERLLKEQERLLKEQERLEQERLKKEQEEQERLLRSSDLYKNLHTLFNNYRFELSRTKENYEKMIKDAATELYNNSGYNNSGPNDELVLNLLFADLKYKEGFDEINGKIINEINLYKAKLIKERESKLFNDLYPLFKSYFDSQSTKEGLDELIKNAAIKIYHNKESNEELVLNLLSEDFKKSMHDTNKIIKEINVYFESKIDLLNRAVIDYKKSHGGYSDVIMGVEFDISEHKKSQSPDNIKNIFASKKTISTIMNSLQEDEPKLSEQEGNLVRRMIHTIKEAFHNFSEFGSILLNSWKTIKKKTAKIDDDFKESGHQEHKK